MTSIHDDDPVCRAPGQPPHVGHFWRQKWDYANPPQLTSRKICSLCHVTSVWPWIPDLTDLEKVKEFLDAPV